MIRVLIVDDSIFIRTILKDFLSKYQDIEIVGAASDGVEALSLIDELRPDVMTLDIEMPKMTGIDVLRKIQNLSHRPKVLMLSSLTSRDASHTRTALALGADDFMLKPQEIFRVRGIQEELVAKVRHLIQIRPAVKNDVSSSQGLARRVLIFGSSAGGLQQLDLILSNISPELAARLGLQGTDGVLINAIDPDSSAAVSRLRRGDVILEVNGKATPNVAAFKSAVGKVKKGDVLRLLVKRGESVLYTTLKAD